MDGSFADQDVTTLAPTRPETVPEAQERVRSDPRHAVSSDRAEHLKDRPETANWLRHARKASGRGAMELAGEFLRLNRGPGKLTLREYVEYGVFDRSRCSPDAQARFITNTLHWPITHACCDMTWQATTEDKWLCAHILARSGIRMPETLAVIDTSGRSYPDTRRISTAGELRAFMTSGVLPLFGKENRGICSYGAFLVEEADDAGLRLRGQGWIDYQTFLAGFVGRTPYLLQRLERNHGSLDRYTGSLATVRVCILVAEHGIRVPFAVLKLPAQRQCRRQLLASRQPRLRPRCRTAAGSSPRAPGTGSEPPITTPTPKPAHHWWGEAVPMWDAVLDLASACAPIFAPVRYQSMDIAVTPDGPVLIEINTGGGFDLPQLATGQGFLTDEVREFFRACGYRKL